MTRTKLLYIVTGLACASLPALGIWQLTRAGLPSADVLAAQAAQTPQIDVSDVEPGETRIMSVQGLPIIIWRRDAREMALAPEQDDPTLWLSQTSRVLGQADPILASDENLTIDGEWLLVVGNSGPGGWFVAPQTGRYDGFFEHRYATHYDLAGRARYQSNGCNLMVVLGTVSEDRQRLTLNLGPDHLRELEC